MFKKNEAPETDLDRLIAQAHSEMAGLDITDEDFKTAADNLAKLYEIRTKTNQGENRVSKDVLVTAAANLIGIVAILAYEETRVIATKAITFAGKLR